MGYMRLQKKLVILCLMVGISAPLSAQDILSCSKLNDDTQRLSCYDTVAGRVEEALSKDVKGVAISRIKEREEAVQAAVIGDYDLAAQEYEGFTIAKIFFNNQRRPVYVSEDGRSFQQVSGINAIASEGEAVQLEQGMFGSLFLVSEAGVRTKVKER